MSNKNVSNSKDIEKTKDVLRSWPLEDIKRLLDRMLRYVPEGDHFCYQKSANNLPWEKIRFDNYTTDECYHTWKLVVEHARRFRLLREVIYDCMEWLKRPWTNFYGAKSKNQHPDRPTQPPNPYLIFLQEFGQKIKNENPGINMIEQSKLIAEAYSNLSSKKRDVYIKKFELRKREYERKLEMFLRENPSEGERKGKKRKKNDTPLSKQFTPFNAYFENEVRSMQKAHGKSYSDMLPEIEDRWTSLPESEKIEWMECANQNLKSIHIQRVPSSDDESNRPRKCFLTKREQKYLDKSLGAPTKPPTTVYNLYTKMIFMSDDLEGFENKTRMQQVSERWRKLTSEEKQQLQREHESQQEEYKKKFSAFLGSLEPDVRDQYEEQLLSKSKAKSVIFRKKRKRKNKESTNVQFLEEEEMKYPKKKNRKANQCIDIEKSIIEIADEAK